MTAAMFRFMDDFLKLAFSRRATEILLATAHPPRLTCGGSSFPVSPLPMTEGQITSIGDALLAESAGDIEFEIRRPGIGAFSVCLARSDEQHRLVVRPLQAPPSMAELGLPAVIENLALRERGLVLLASRIGHDLGVELGSLIRHRVTHRPDHVLLVAPSGRYAFSGYPGGVTQCHPQHDRLWQGALADTQPLPVKVLVLSEARSSQDVAAALDFAERGLSLVMVDADEVTVGIERLLRLFPIEQRQNLLGRLGRLLTAAVAFRSVPREVHGHEPAAPDAQGVAAVELLLCDGAVAELLRHDRLNLLRSVMEAHPPMQTLEQSLFDLWAGYTIDAQGALRNANRCEEVRRLMQEAPRRSWIG